MEKYLSIIIPAYNSDRFLNRCLDSLICEPIMDDVEVIVVNDGSKDKTSEIAHSYEERYPGYFKVIDKENGNYGSVMNVGLKNATGKYFKTLDSDDWYDTYAFEKFINELKETDADLVFCDFVRYNENDNTRVIFSADSCLEKSKDLIITEDIWKFKTFYNIHCTSYKTELLRKSGIVWPNNVFYSDLQTLFWPERLCKTVRFIPYPVYVYLEGRNDQSMSFTSKIKNFKSYDIVANNILDEFIRVYDSRNPMSSQQERHLLYILGQFYSYLTLYEFKDLKCIERLDNKLKAIPFIYNEIEQRLFWCGYCYVKLFRQKNLNRIKFILFKIRVFVSYLKRHHL